MPRWILELFREVVGQTRRCRGEVGWKVRDTSRLGGAGSKEHPRAAQGQDVGLPAHTRQRQPGQAKAF